MDIGVYLKFSLRGRHKTGKGVGEEREPLPSLPSPPSLFPFLPFSQSPTPFDACYADYFILTLILFKLR